MSGSGDGSVIKYSSPGGTFGSDADGRNPAVRFYIPGNESGLATTVGPDLTSYYSSGKFKPGTTIVWEPSCSFSTSGRMFVGFTDNPEVAVAIMTLLEAYVATPGNTNWNNYVSQVKGLGTSMSFPVWQETEVPFPTRLRRKRFDCNRTAVLTSADVLDRSMQTCMFIALEGTPASTTVGNFQYRDVVDVEGLHAVST